VILAEIDAGNILVWIVWVLAALALLSSGIAVVLFANPFYSALALIANLSSLAVLYLLLDAEFVAAAQVLVYAGAVVVMFLFVIAYLGGRADAPWAGGPTLQAVAAVVAAAAIAVEVVVVIALKAGDRLSDTAEVQETLAFEVTSIVLLVAAIGGVILGSALPREQRAEGGR
jgi:NADH:ubiquinone oxidoreductase subunit 6 (subunit J)